MRGITVRTNNANEMNPNTAQIYNTMKKFFIDVQSKILNKTNSGRVFSVYTNYDSDFNGDYTYFIGEEVTDLSNKDQELSTLIIPEQKYMKFTSNVGQIPDIVIDTWKNIWQMSDVQLDGSRSYIADFEIYDECRKDLSKSTINIYIGITK